MNVVCVEFKKGGKQYTFFDNNLELFIDDNVVVETERGMQFGTIVKERFSVSETEEHAPIIRKASKKDEEQNARNIKEALKCVEKAQEIADSLSLEMKFIDGFYTFDQRQLVLHFIADNRVDFRELAKNLASLYRTRIELRQVGVRDKAKEISGIGCCGRKLCCSCFLNDLDSVGISMVKNQNLALNPSKINGLCGRLLCCLKYEDDVYTENRKTMPTQGDRISIDGEDGVVVSIDIPRKKYIVLMGNGNRVEKFAETKCDRCNKCGKNEGKSSN